MTHCKTNRCGQGHKPCPTATACGLRQHNTDGTHADDSMFIDPWGWALELLIRAVYAVGLVAIVILLAGLSGYFWGLP